MWKNKNWNEFQSCISDLIDTPDVQSLNDYGAHLLTNCYQHSVFVAYVSFRICKAFHWDFVAAARGGLLHDLFLYDRKDKTSYAGNHLAAHPRTALKNARSLCWLSRREEDIIVKHMWPVTLRFPRYRESYVVNVVDKLCAATECLPIYRLLHVKRGLHFA